MVNKSVHPVPISVLSFFGARSFLTLCLRDCVGQKKVTRNKCRFSPPPDSSSRLSSLKRPDVLVEWSTAELRIVCCIEERFASFFFFPQWSRSSFPVQTTHFSLFPLHGSFSFSPAFISSAFTTTSAIFVTRRPKLLFLRHCCFSFSIFFFLTTLYVQV